MKIRNLRAMQHHLLGPAVVQTWNAPENGPMIAVNDALGFETVQNLCEYQRPV